MGLGCAERIGRSTVCLKWDDKHGNAVMVDLTTGIIWYGNGYRILMGTVDLVMLAWHGVI